MDPHHRDSIAFMRICSGKFDREEFVHHSGSEKKVKLMNSHKLFGQEREVVEDGYPGDIVGLVGYSAFKIGDTLTADPSIAFHEIPTFPPECFAFVHNPTPGKYKAFRKGIETILNEGIVQMLTIRHSLKGPLLTAVGPLQFEVLQYRLQSEYGADSKLENGPWQLAKWVNTEIEYGALKDMLPFGAEVAEDKNGRLVILFPTTWSVKSFQEFHPKIELLNIAPAPGADNPVKV